MLTKMKKPIKIAAICLAIILLIVFLRSCFVGVLGWKYGLFQYKINFWATNESFEYLADEVSEIFNESKKEYPEIDRITVYPNGTNILAVHGLKENKTIFSKSLSVSAKLIEHYNKVSKNFASRKKNDGLWMIDAYDGYVVFISYAPYAIIRHENGVIPKAFGPHKSDTFYAERISFRWFHGTSYSSK